ncbi:putative AC9 transposase [Sparassis crispa]|uniref:Putative AC9 transposase n=1 Tax=Sparassis crispa TaxID=139825 RepID=A0A401GJE1_9APHY|nr:putative AC9 transposase [Sparassis crispa]GBE82287.1 putative AC9 transposase [Sparassis crispa]
MVSHDVKLVFAQTRKRIAKMLQKYDGDLNFATNAWTSPNHKAFVAVSVHLEREGEPLVMVLNVVEVAQSHSGLNLASTFAKILDDFGILDKILSLTADNASSNDTMTEGLINLLLDFALLRQFGIPKKSEGDGLDDSEQDLVVMGGQDLITPNLRYSAPSSILERCACIKVVRHVTLVDLAKDLDFEDLVTRAEKGAEDTGDEATVDESEDEELLEGLFDFTDDKHVSLAENVRPVNLVLVKLRKLAFKIVHSMTIILPAWYATLNDLKLAERIMLHYRKAIDTISADRELGLQQFESSEEEWAIASQLRDVLKILKDAMLFFSHFTPNLVTVIPATDHINKRLTTESLDKTLNIAIHTLLGLAKKTLNKYYTLTDSSEVYRIAMVLHPRHKLSYFKQAKWEQSWINTTEELVREEFRCSYSMSGDKESGGGMQSPEQLANIKNKNHNIFDHIPALVAPKHSELQNELDAYLSTDPEYVENFLTWWHRVCVTYPRLSRMALDYLTIPATSVNVERILRCGRLLLSHVRSRLSAQTIRALLCLGSWSLLGMVEDADVKAVTVMADMPGDEEEMEDGWDSIQ